jgi:hypothetical protein
MHSLILMIALGALSEAHSSPDVPETPESTGGTSPSDVIELFKALPESALHTRIRNRTTVLDVNRNDETRAHKLELDSWTKHDASTGTFRITSIGDGEGWHEQFRVYALPTGESVLLSVSTNWGMCGSQSKVSVWQFGSDGPVEVTETRWPGLSWTDFNGGTPTAEKHSRTPSYSVAIGETGDAVVQLDQCQFEYPGELGPIIFDASVNAFARALQLRWGDERFVLHESPSPNPK